MTVEYPLALPQEGMYSPPPPGVKEMTLTAVDGETTRTFTIEVRAIAPNWGKDFIRIDGFTNYEGESRTVVATCRVNTTQGYLGTLTIYVA